MKCRVFIQPRAERDIEAAADSVFDQSKSAGAVSRTVRRARRRGACADGAAFGAAAGRWKVSSGGPVGGICKPTLYKYVEEVGS